MQPIACWCHSADSSWVPTACLNVTSSILKMLSTITQKAPILFHLRCFGVSIASLALGLRNTRRYIRPGSVNDVVDMPKAPTNSNTTAISPMNIDANMQLTYNITEIE